MSINNKCAKCGCEDSYLTTPPPCPTAIGCPFEECAEIQYAQCIMYTGGDILCGEDLVVPTDTNMEAAITNIVDYFCLPPIPEILCGEAVVVTEDSSINVALEDIVDYFCDEIANINIAITSIEGDITAIEGDITTIEGNITTLQTNQGLFDTGFRGYISPDSFPSKTFDKPNSNISLGDTVVFNTTSGVMEYQIKDGVNFSQYNQTTGIWTCPQTGKYDFNYNVYLSSPANTYGWGQVGGTFTIGITDPTGAAIIYCADTFTAVRDFYYDKIYMTGGMQGVTISANTQIVLKIQNLTGVAYTEQRTLGDNIEWAIRRVG